MFVYNNGTNVVEAVTQFNGTIVLTSGVSGVLPIANGGTGTSSTTFTNLTTNVTGTLPIANGGTGSTSTTFVNAATNVTGTLPTANGGTGATSLAAANIATLGYTTTATSAGTTTLTASSTATQFFTGTATQTVILPVTSTLVLGQQFTIHNNSTGDVSIQSSGANAIITGVAGASIILTCILTSGTTAASWDADITGFSAALPTNRGGTGLTTAGTANQVLTTNGTTLSYAKVGIANLSASGSPSASTFLRGDNTWGTAGGVTGAFGYQANCYSFGNCGNCPSPVKLGNGIYTALSGTTLYGQEATQNCTDCNCNC
jgi:hypothetical protein